MANGPIPLSKYSYITVRQSAFRYPNYYIVDNSQVPHFLLQACYQNVSLMHCCPSAGASSFVKRIDRTRVTVISDASTCAMYIVHTCFVPTGQVVVIGAA